MATEAIDEFVWCDWEGTAHEASDDPNDYGPRYPKDVMWGADPTELEDGWVIREAGDEYSQETLAFYVCPGPHTPLYRKEPSMADDKKPLTATQARVLKQHIEAEMDDLHRQFQQKERPLTASEKKAQALNARFKARLTKIQAEIDKAIEDDPNLRRNNDVACHNVVGTSRSYFQQERQVIDYIAQTRRNLLRQVRLAQLTGETADLLGQIPTLDDVLAAAEGND